MSKKNFFKKYFKNIINFINNLLEKNLNKLNFKNLSNLFKNNKIILIFVAVCVTFVSYLLIPTFYKQSYILKKLETEVKNKFDINLKFQKNLQYNLFPKPHFTITETNIYDDTGEISEIDNLKIFISLDNLFSIKKIQIRNLIIQNANFDLNKKNYNFFFNLLNQNFENGSLIIKNSNIFFRSMEDEVLFINKIKKLKYSYNPKELKNFFLAHNEVFNIPYSIETFYNEDKNKVLSQINLNLIKLKIENELSINNEEKIGKSELIYNKLKRIAEYKIGANYFRFNIFDKIDQPRKTYRGEFNFKPFFASLDADLDIINLNYLFDSNSIIVQLLKTEIFNNKNIDFNLNINADKIYNKINFKKISLKSKIQDGLIDTDNTKFSWKNFVDFEFLESLIFVKNGELVLDGRLKIDVNNYNEVYKFFLTPKKYRNKIKKIDLNFTYNFDQNIAELKDIKIDDKIDKNVNKILNSLILKKNDLQNKIYFKNLFNEAIKSYAG